MDNVYFLRPQGEKLSSMLRIKEASETWRAVKPYYLAYIFRMFRGARGIMLQAAW
jgi:hypothetical protein